MYFMSQYFLYVYINMYIFLFFIFIFFILTITVERRFFDHLYNLAKTSQNEEALER